MDTWHVDHSTIRDSNGDPIAIVADPDGPTDGKRIDWPWVYSEAPPEGYAEAEANAYLIAAAPALREVCQLVLWGLTDDADFNDGKVDRNGLVQALREALAKASSE